MYDREPERDQREADQRLDRSCRRPLPPVAARTRAARCAPFDQRTGRPAARLRRASAPRGSRRTRRAASGARGCSRTRRPSEHEEQRLGVDGREEDRRREDRDVEDRAVRDVAVVLVLDQLVEVEQREEAARRWRSASPAIRWLPIELADDADQQRIERKERHVGAVVAVGRDVDVVHGVPASPDGEQRDATRRRSARRRAGR